MFTKEEPITQLMTKEPTVPVAHLSQLMDALHDNYMAVNRIDPALAQRIVDLIYEH